MTEGGGAKPMRFTSIYQLYELDNSFQVNENRFDGLYFSKPSQGGVGFLAVTNMMYTMHLKRVRRAQSL